MKKLMLLMVFCCTVILPVHSASYTNLLGNEPASKEVIFPDFSKKDVISGEEIKFGDTLKKDGVSGAVLFFTSYNCPYAIADQTATNKLVKKYEGKIAFIGINANVGLKGEGADRKPGEDATGMAAHAKKDGLNYPIVMDDYSRLARNLGASTTPEYYLVNNAGKVVYHGPLEDAGDPQNVKTYLVNAIESLLAGKEIAPDVRDLPPSGCSIKHLTFPNIKGNDLTIDEAMNLEDLLDQEGIKGAVVYFTSTDSPSVAEYQERINKLSEVNKGQIVFVALNASSHTENAEKQKQVALDRKINHAVLMGEGATIAREVGARVTPEFFLIDRKGNIVYSGPLDDNKDAAGVKESYLEKAIVAFTSGKPLPGGERVREAVGSAITPVKK
jgi:thiol-disulfide isomerase/thioredoxin